MIQRRTGDVEFRSDALAIASLARVVDGVVGVDDQLHGREADVRGGALISPTVARPWARWPCGPGTSGTGRRLNRESSSR
jgi:hypothetical protein